MTDKKIHWATQRRLDIEAALREGRPPPPWPQSSRKRATVDFLTPQTLPSDQPAPVLSPPHNTPAPIATNWLAGLGPKNCANACGPNCVITGDMCGHPFQSNLQAPHKMKPDVMRRYAEALAYLEHLAIDRKVG
jgi:hypothetical protein